MSTRLASAKIVIHSVISGCCVSPLFGLTMGSLGSFERRVEQHTTSSLPHFSLCAARPVGRLLEPTSGGVVKIAEWCKFAANNISWRRRNSRLAMDGAHL